MHIVAIYNLPHEKAARAEALAAALKTTLYEAASRLKAPGNGPFVVGVTASIEHAGELSARLRAGGFDAILLRDDEIETARARFVVRKFRLSGDALVAESRTGESLGIDYPNIDLIVRGTSLSETTVTESVKEKKFDPRMALLTGGLKMTRTREKTMENTAHTREGFFHLYAGDQQTLSFREDGLLYDSLGLALQPTRQANFSHLIEEIRRWSSNALYDDRLLSRAGQVQLLGPSLSPEKHLDIAITLLAKLLR